MAVAPAESRLMTLIASSPSSNEPRLDRSNPRVDCRSTLRHVPAFHDRRTVGDWPRVKVEISQRDHSRPFINAKRHLRVLTGRDPLRNHLPSRRPDTIAVASRAPDDSLPVLPFHRFVCARGRWRDDLTYAAQALPDRMRVGRFMFYSLSSAWPGGVLLSFDVVDVAADAVS